MRCRQFSAFWRRLLPPLLLSAGLVFFSGCRTLPNAQPFRDATGTLKDAVAVAGAAVSAELKALPPEKAQAKIGEFESAWTGRNAAMTALVDYAASVQAIVEAGRSGEAEVKRLVTAGESLSRSLGVAWPGATAAGGLAVDALAYVTGLIDTVRAAKSLEASLGAMQPAIERVSKLFQEELRSVDDMITFAAAAESGGLALGEDRASLAYHRQLIATQDALQEKIRGQLGGTPPIAPSKLQGTDELSRVEALLAQKAAWYADYQARQAAIARRAQLAHQAIAHTRVAFAAWSELHAQLLATVRTRRPPSPTELLAAVGRVHAFIERYHEL